MMRWRQDSTVFLLLLLINQTACTENFTEKTDQLKVALEYVNRVKTGECSGGTDETLFLEFDRTVWDGYATIAIKTANLFSKLLMDGNGTFQNVSDKFFFSVVRNNVHDFSPIFGSAVALETDVQAGYKQFSPYAYKKNGTVQSHDLSTNYDYPRSEWYNASKMKSKQNVSIWRDNVAYRLNATMSYPDLPIVQPVASLSDGHWTYPYFDCGGGDIWMVTYSSPIMWIPGDLGTVIFKGVATIDIELTNIDINQCDAEESQVESSSTPKALDVFRGTHSCQPTTKCVSITGLGFQRGSYKCDCVDGYYFPNKTSRDGFFKGEVIENYFDKQKHVGVVEQFQCLHCARGCDVCVDDTICMFEMSIVARTIIFLLTLITMFSIVAMAIVVFLQRDKKAIKSGSPIFLLIMCFGGILMCFEVFILYREPDDLICSITLWPTHVGFMLLYGALIFKTWRISVIFKVGKVRRVQLPDKQLLKRFFPVVFITVVFLITWNMTAPPSAISLKTESSLKYVHCSSNVWTHAALGAEAAFLLFGVYLCFTVRKAPANFNESKFITWSTYNAIILGSFIIIVTHFAALSIGPDVLYLLYFLRLQVNVTITLCLIFIPKFWVLYNSIYGDAFEEGQVQTITGRVINKQVVGTIDSYGFRDAETQTNGLYSNKPCSCGGYLPSGRPASQLSQTSNTSRQKNKIAPLDS